MLQAAGVTGIIREVGTVLRNPLIIYQHSPNPSSTKSRKLKHNPSADTPQLEQKIDLLVYHLYDLNGRRLERPQKGINIIGGKKVMVK